MPILRTKTYGTYNSIVYAIPPSYRSIQGTPFLICLASESDRKSIITTQKEFYSHNNS